MFRNRHFCYLCGELIARTLNQAELHTSLTRHYVRCSMHGSGEHLALPVQPVRPRRLRRLFGVDVRHFFEVDVRNFFEHDVRNLFQRRRRIYA